MIIQFNDGRSKRGFVGNIMLQKEASLKLNLNVNEYL